MAGRDITEGRGDSSGFGRSIAVDLGIAAGSVWANTGDSYDIAIGGVPFLTAINDARPYERATAPFRKQQFDSQRDPGEQSLSTWWIRSQSSFHAGESVLFYDPFANPFSTTLASNSYRYNDSLGVEVFEGMGQVTLLKRPALTQSTTAARKVMSVTIAGVDKALLHDGGALKLTDGTTSAMTTLSAGVATTIYASANDGVNGNSGGGGGGAYGGLNSGGGTNYDANLTSSSINVAGGGKSNQDGYVIITWGSVTPTLINPMSVSPYINIWFDAADSTTVTGTTAVSAWASKGTFIIDAAVPRTGTTSYITANQNGLNIIRCGAGVDMTFAFGSPTQSRAWFIVAKNTTQLVSSGLGQYWTLVNQTQSDYQDSPSGPNYAGGAYVMGEGPSTRGTNILATTNNNPYNAWKCYTWVNSATSAANNYIGINTTSYTLTESRPAILDGNTTAGYGYRTDKVTYSINTQIYGTGADIGEIMMYNDEITSTDRDTVISYLMTKWGIT